jgi:hypothetical protein
MSDNALNTDIRNAVFSELGIRLSEHDPIFSVVLANKLMLGSAGEALHQVVRDIPSAIESSISKIVLAVEDSEKTVGSLRDETKGMLNALSKLEIEQTHKRIKEIAVADISKSVVDSTQLLQSAVVEAEKKIRDVSTGLRDSRLFIANLALSASLAFIILFSGIGLFIMYKSMAESRETSQFWYDKYQSQNEAVETLAPTVKKQVSDILKSKTQK